ncbi:hypothetical protein EBS02_12030, partial [bacterium]|nr:hypothetical protein [bacterium]
CLLLSNFDEEKKIEYETNFSTFVTIVHLYLLGFPEDDSPSLYKNEYMSTFIHFVDTHSVPEMMNLLQQKINERDKIRRLVILVGKGILGWTGAVFLTGVIVGIGSTLRYMNKLQKRIQKRIVNVSPRPTNLLGSMK